MMIWIKATFWKGKIKYIMIGLHKRKPTKSPQNIFILNHLSWIKAQLVKKNKDSVHLNLNKQVQRKKYHFCQ